MTVRFRLRTQAAQDRSGGVLTGLRNGTLWVLTGGGAEEPKVVLRLAFADDRYFDVEPKDARLLAVLLRAHATLAQRAMPWQPDEEPSGKPTKVRHGGWGQDGGWVQCWTPWPPPDPPQVWLIAGETVVLGFAQAVELAQALEDTAGPEPV